VNPEVYDGWEEEGEDALRAGISDADQFLGKTSLGRVWSAKAFL
jgi:hypothetical protein